VLGPTAELRLSLPKPEEGNTVLKPCPAPAPSPLGPVAAPGPAGSGSPACVPANAGPAADAELCSPLLYRASAAAEPAPCSWPDPPGDMCTPPAAAAASPAPAPGANTGSGPAPPELPGCPGPGARNGAGAGCEGSERCLSAELEIARAPPPPHMAVSGSRLAASQARHARSAAWGSRAIPAIAVWSVACPRNMLWMWREKCRLQSRAQLGSAQFGRAQLEAHPRRQGVATASCVHLSHVSASGHSLSSYHTEAVPLGAHPSGAAVGAQRLVARARAAEMASDAGYYPYEQDAGMFAGDGYQDAEYALEDNGLHMTAFGAQGNPKAQDKHTISRGWEKFAFPKAVRLLRQGLTLVHFSAQLEPVLTHTNTLHTLSTPEYPLNTGYTTPTRTPYPIQSAKVELKSGRV